MVHVVDRAEEEFPFSGNVRFEGLESGNELLADTRQVRGAYLESFGRFQRAVEKACAQHQIDCLKVRTSDRLDTALARFLTSGARGY